MSLSTKILIWIGVVVTIGSLGFIIFKQNEISTRQTAIETQVIAQKQLSDSIIRAQSEFATKNDIDKFITASGVNLKAIQDDLNKLHAEVNTVNTLVVNSMGQHTTNVSSTGIGSHNPDPPPVVTCKDGTPCPNTDQFGYQQNTQQLTLSEDFGASKVPFGTVGFSAWQKAPWSVDVLPREYHVTNVVGTDENQRMYFYNKFSVKVADKSYDVNITSSQTKQEYPEAKWNWWNPRAFLTSGGGINLTQFSPSANLGVTLGVMSYGQFKTTPSISVLQVGAVYQTSTRSVAAIINPVSFNVGGLLPKGIVDNTYVGPSLQLDTHGNIFVGANISVGF